MCWAAEGQIGFGLGDDSSVNPRCCMSCDSETFYRALVVQIIKMN